MRIPLLRSNTVKVRSGFSALAFKILDPTEVSGLLRMCRCRSFGTFNVLAMLCLLGLIRADFFGPVCDLRSGLRVVRRSDIRIERQWQPDREDRRRGEEHKLPVALELQVHEKHHDAKRFGDGNRQHQHDCERFVQMDHVENNRESRADAQDSEDREVIHMMSIM